MNHSYHLKKLPGILLLCLSIVHLNAQQVETDDLEELEPTTLISTRTERSALESPASIISINLSDEGVDSVENAGDAVRRTPGVSIPFDYRGVDALIPYVNGGYKSYNIRGVEGNRVLLQIDGIRQVPEYSEYLGGGPGGTTRAMFDPKVFESIEILKGSASALYGSDALGGVVSFKTTSLVDILEVSEKPWYLAASMTYTGVNDGINLVGKAGVRSGDFYATLVNSYRETSEYENTQGIDPYPEAMTSNHTLLSFAYIPSEEHRFSLVAEKFFSDNETDFTGIVYNMSIMGMPYTFNYWENASSEAEIGRDRISLKYENNRNDGGLWDEFSAHLYTQSSNSDIITRTTGTVGFAANSLYPGYSPVKRDRYDTMEFAHDSIGLNLLAMKKISSDSIEQTIIVGADFF